MKKTVVIIALISVVSAASLGLAPGGVVGDKPLGSHKPPHTRSVLVSPIGEMRAVLGPQGKSIVVNNDGRAVAVIYGDPTTSSDNPMEIYVAYSTDGGTSFTTYGAFSPELRRIYPGVDAVPDFAEVPGHIFFSWHESPFGYNTDDQKTMLDENVPSSPLFTRPLSLPAANTLFTWMTCISVAPDDPTHLIASGWSYLNGGNGDLVVWLSDDGGYEWIGPIVLDNLPVTGGAGAHIRQGTGGYVAATYHDLYNWDGTDIEYPYLIESTDGGITWLPRIALPVPFADPANSQFWWYELDLEVINNEPWIIHTDLGIDSMWLFCPSGGDPGSWTWDIGNIKKLGRVEACVSDTYYYCEPGGFPSIAYDHQSGVIMVTYKAYYYHGDSMSWSDMNGPHIGGVYTMDGGNSWVASRPLQRVLNNGNITVGDWNATETAHYLVYDVGAVWAYTVWVNETELNLYFEKGNISKFGVSDAALGDELSAGLNIAPSIVLDQCCVIFHLNSSDLVTVALYDASGRKIETIFNGYLIAGDHRIAINTSHLANGTYFITFKSSSLRQIAKFIKVH